MSYKIVAISQLEGAGIVQDQNGFRLVRPPYTLASSTQMSSQNVDRAIQKYGFSVCDKVFKDLSAVIEFLNDESLKAQNAEGRRIPNEIEIQDMVNIAPESVLLTFLARVEEELLPKREFDYAEAVLLAILGTELAQQNPNLLSKTREGLTKIHNARKKPDFAGVASALMEVLFPSLADELHAIEGVVSKIQKRGTFFATAA